MRSSERHAPPLRERGLRLLPGLRRSVVLPAHRHDLRGAGSSAIALLRARGLWPVPLHLLPPPAGRGRRLRPLRAQNRPAASLWRTGPAASQQRASTKPLLYTTMHFVCITTKGRGRGGGGRERFPFGGASPLHWPPATLEEPVVPHPRPLPVRVRGDLKPRVQGPNLRDPLRQWFRGIFGLLHLLG